MKMTIDMPLVSGCKVNECAYNVDQGCHARAITIGDGVHAGCDTFLNVSAHTRDEHRVAGVGACKVTSCAHNDDFECTAEDVSVGFIGDRINCLTFTAQ
jgi:hypothetical protein